MKSFYGLQFIASDNQDFAGFDFANVRCTDEVEGAGFGGKHVGTVGRPAEVQGPKTIRIADGN